MISGVQQIHVQIEDINRAIDFYQNTLDLPLMMSFPEQNMAFFDCAGTRLYLGKNPEYESKAFIYYQTSNIDKAYQELVDKQVSIIKEPTMIHKTDDSESWLCAFKDSEDNTLHLMQEKRI